MEHEETKASTYDPHQLGHFRIRAKLKEQDNSSLSKAREKINALSAKQAHRWSPGHIGGDLLEDLCCQLHSTEENRATTSPGAFFPSWTADASFVMDNGPSPRTPARFEKLGLCC
ncbi:hypothetical protein GGR56DRAFT_678207 [Xylariaceae sp. FL0804]|nr:hypothetical protein GGR56DRAFT_678207 [Xylariaceae sp. FL0804]